MKKSVLRPDGIAAPKGNWSPVVVCDGGKLVFIAGQLARGENGRIVGVGDIEQQTAQVCRNLERSVEAAGGSLANIVRVDVFVTDMRWFPTIHKVRSEFFGTEPPASTMVQVTGFTEPDALIEITAIAVI